jgi:hypothetical protein
MTHASFHIQCYDDIKGYQARGYDDASKAISGGIFAAIDGCHLSFRSSINLFLSYLSLTRRFIGYV